MLKNVIFALGVEGIKRKKHILQRKKTMKRYLKLIRPYGMLFLGFTPVFGAIANGEFTQSHLIILFTKQLLKIDI